MEKHNKSRISRNYKKCVICNRRRTPGSDVHLFRIPLAPDRCRLWLKAIGQEELVDLPIEKLHELKSVCNIHFLPKEFNERTKRLATNAVPTLNIPLQPLDDQLFADFPMHIGQYPSHEVPGYLTRITPKENQAPQINQGENEMQQEAHTSLPSTSYDPNTLQDITNMEFGLSKATPATEERKYAVDFTCSSDAPVASTSRADDIIVQSYKRKSAEEAKGSSDAPVASTSREDDIIVQSYKRKRKSAEEVKDVDTREEKLLKKLKTQKLTIRRLSRSSINIDELDNAILKNLVDDLRINHKKKPTGKRWSIKTKMWCLAIFKRSPKAYRYLQWGLSLPSVKTLQRLLQSVALGPGINLHYIQKAKEMLQKFSNKDKLCALLFDEIALKKRLIYNETSDLIEGYEDYGDERRSGIADHALVFMVQGLRKKYKLPIAYYFVKGTISSEKLYVIIKNVIKVLEEVSFKIVTTVCDQGPTNVGALTLLRKFGGQSPEENFFTFEKKKIFIMFDVPHLFKSIRNNFYNAGEIKWGEKTAKWCWLVEAEKNNKNFLDFPKVTQNVVHPSYKIKMRVKYAAHALSNTMAAVLNMLSWKYVSAASEIRETADIVKKIDQLFDVCNGPSSPKDVKKGIRENVSSQTKHVEMWGRFYDEMDGIKFMKSDSHLQLKHVRCIKGFKITLKSLKDIWHSVKKEGFSFLNLRQLNQDALENLFGMIRQHSATNKNPTCSHFTAALKASIIVGLSAPHSRGSNCEPDANEFLFNYSNVKKIMNEVESTQSEIFVNETDNIPVLSLPEEDEDDHIIEKLCSFEDQPVVYVSGYLAARLVQTLNCNNCKNSLINKDPESNMYTYISLREWWDDKKSLTYPSVGLCQTVTQAKSVFENLKHYHTNFLSVNCVTQFMVHCNVAWLSCIEHDIKQELFKKIAILFIRKHCKVMNAKFVTDEATATNNYKNKRPSASRTRP